MNKLRAIIIFFFLACPFFSTQAMLRSEIAVNDNSKQCQFFQPTGKNELPDGWRFLKYTGSSFEANDLKNECKKNGYSFLPGELKGEISPIYLSMIIIYNGIFIISGIFLLIALIKTKKKKIIIIALCGVIVLYMFLRYISSLMV